MNLQSPCDAQTLRLNLIFTMATFALLASALPAGLLLDRFGARKVTLCASSLVALGSAMMAVSNSKSISFVSAVNSNSVARPLYIPAYCLMGIGGNTVGMGLFTLGKLCKKHQAAIVGAFTANWNASPIVLLIFSVLFPAQLILNSVRFFMFMQAFHSKLYSLAFWQFLRCWHY